MVNNLSIIQNGASELLNNFSIIEYLSTIKSLIILILGIVLYGLFFFKFYRFLAKRDILELELNKYSIFFDGFIKTIVHIILYVIENIIIIPILIFGWFIILALFLLVLSKNHSPETILLTAISFVASIRICAYYNEELSRDLAKTIPLTLLAVFLIDYVSFFSFDNIVNTLINILPLWKTAIYYLFFVMMIELILRVIEIFTKLVKE